MGWGSGWCSASFFFFKSGPTCLGMDAQSRLRLPYTNCQSRQSLIGMAAGPPALRSSSVEVSSSLDSMLCAVVS